MSNLTEEIKEELEGRKVGSIDIGNLNDSESRVLKWLIDDCGLEEELIRRKSSGVDFVYNGNIGIEVKLREPYSIRESQIKESNVYDKVFVVIGKKNNVYIKDCIEDVNFGDENGLITMGDVPEWKGPAIRLYDAMQREFETEYGTNKRRWVPDQVSVDNDSKDSRRFYEEGFWVGDGLVPLLYASLTCILHVGGDGDIHWRDGGGMSYPTPSHLPPIHWNRGSGDIEVFSNKIIDVVELLENRRDLFDDEMDRMYKMVEDRFR